MRIWIVALVVVMLPCVVFAQISWTEHLVDGDFDFTSGVYAADVDGDGYMDILGAAWYANDITWWENDGTPADGGWIEHTVDGDFEYARSVFATDIDGDGDNDILGAANSDSITWWENVNGDGLTWAEHLIDGAFDTAIHAFATDVDGDGDCDVLGAASVADDIAWYENDGTPADGGWTKHILNGTFDGAFYVYATDLDGDGDCDVLGAAAYAKDITWWENDGTPGDGGWTEHTIDGEYDHANCVYAADVNGDGDVDVLGASQFDHDITWWENDGTPADGGWTEHTIEGNFSFAYCVYATDVDYDGDVDVLGAAESGDDVTWWENVNGDGLTWNETVLNGDLDGAMSVYAADVDGDGDVDIMAAAAYADDIVWWESDFIDEPYEISIAGVVDGSTIIASGMVAGMRTEATDGYDALYDIPKPAPPASDYLDVYFPHTGWAGGVFGNRWAVDVRDSDVDLDVTVKVWELVSATDQLAEDVTLTFTIEPGYPLMYPVFLYDTDALVYQNLRTDNTYTYTDDGTDRDLELRVGDNTPPVVTVIDPASGVLWVSNSSQTINWTIDDVSPIVSITLEYSLDAGTTWTVIDNLTTDPDTYSWTVPNVYTTDARIRITATDLPGNTANDVCDAFYIAPNTMSFDAVVGWQMVSPPLTPADNSNAAVFGDDLTGTYFVYSYSPGTDYQLVSSTDPGEGYWLGTDGAATVDIDGDAELVEVEVALDQGWNMIGSGFPPTILRSALVIDNGVTTNVFADAVTAGWISSAFYGYDTGTSSYTLETELDPWTGYWLMALQPSLTLYVYPPDPGESAELDDFNPEDGWLLPVHLVMGDLEDELAGVGVHVDASDGFDPAFDLPVAPLPPAGGYVRAIIDHEEWDSPAGRFYAQDIRGPLELGETQVWDILIQSDHSGEVTIQIGDESGIPTAVPGNVMLTATFQSQFVNLRELNTYTFAYSGSPELLRITARNLPVEFSLSPVNDQIPPSGGTLVYDAQLTNLGGETYSNVLYWTEVIAPDETVYGPLFEQRLNITPFMELSASGLTQNVPAFAPAGTYTFIGHLRYQTIFRETDSFTFEKSGVATDGVDNWDANGYLLAESEVAPALSLPVEYAVKVAYPNPFNPSTTIAVDLPEMADLSVIVYNITGQQVVILADRQYEAGSHTLTFDASNLASGLYFVSVRVPGKLDQTQKVMLVR